MMQQFQLTESKDPHDENVAVDCASMASYNILLLLKWSYYTFSVLMLYIYFCELEVDVFEYWLVMNC